MKLIERLFPPRKTPRELRVSEMFESWIGEGANTGVPAVFVRFSGCNLDCEECDTPQKDETNFFFSSIEDFIHYLDDNFPKRILVLTGGEPLLQVDSLILTLLIEHGWRNIQIETNATMPYYFSQPSLEDLVFLRGGAGKEPRIPTDVVESRIWLSASPKPGRVNFLTLQRADEVKIVWPFSREWFERLVVMKERYALLDSESRLWLMPWMNENYEENLGECARLSKEYNVPITLQWHKIVRWR